MSCSARPHGTAGGWTTPGVLPPPGAFCYETTQLARYEPGQHFLEHEDAFPVHDARAQGFQRRATLLVYLNTPEGGGGTTRFEKVGCEVSPREGRALLFFPARGGELAVRPTRARCTRLQTPGARSG